MSAPYIIWTFQRTGGTTLAGLLADLSEHPRVEHEPFNANRIFGDAIRAYRQTNDLEALRKTLTHLLGERPVIKHCHELLPDAFNRTLLEVSLVFGYAHVILDRKAEVDRVLSRELARQTGAWGKKGANKVRRQLANGQAEISALSLDPALENMTLCAKRRIALARMLEDHAVSPFHLTFEELYDEPESGQARVLDLLEFLGFEPDAVGDIQPRLQEALNTRGQNSASLLELVPNIADLRSALERHALTLRGSLV